MVPASAATGYTRHQANAISLATILLVTLSGAIGFAVSSAIDVPVGLAMGLGGVIGATTGAHWASTLSAVTLARFFGVLLIVVGLRLLLVGGTPEPPAAADLPWSLVVTGLIGAAAGLISGLAGIGGGVIMVPAVILLLGLDQHTVEGTSLLAIICTAAAGSRVNVSNRYFEWRAVGLLAIGGVVIAPLAAVVAQRIPADALTRIFAVWVLLIAARTLMRSQPVSRRAGD